MKFYEDPKNVESYIQMAEGYDGRELIDAILTVGVKEMTLLDIGGGLGAIQHELLAAGASQATHVEASSAYLQAAQEESRRFNIQDQITYFRII